MSNRVVVSFLATIRLWQDELGIVPQKFAILRGNRARSDIRTGESWASGPLPPPFYKILL